ncbi:hypothetical protein ACRPOS_007270 [Bartonella heixiaziensis]|uniref:hypothetical protein n=1 Tax=Bartonella heixiaziensis TaxID=1461000 RepID=UPI0039088A1D
MFWWTVARGVEEDWGRGYACCVLSVVLDGGGVCCILGVAFLCTRVGAEHMGLSMLWFSRD